VAVIGGASSRRPRNVHVVAGVVAAEQVDGVLVAVAGEVPVGAVDVDQAGAL
jgi:hypothetical protein